MLCYLIKKSVTRVYSNIVQFESVQAYLVPRVQQHGRMGKVHVTELIILVVKAFFRHADG